MIEYYEFPINGDEEEIELIKKINEDIRKINEEEIELIRKINE